jgi:hypothetical protein
MNIWKIATAVLMVAWLLPGRYTLEVREPTSVDVQALVNAGRANQISNMLVVGGVVKHASAVEWMSPCSPICESGEHVLYFRHWERRWYFPWWSERPYPVFYTHPISEREAFAHGHLGLSR